MKDKILALRKDGNTYQEIANILGITRYQVEYHANPKRKEIQKKGSAKYHRKNPIYKKVANFRAITPKEVRVETFSMQNFLEKIGEFPKCYYTGTPIDILKQETYSIDHKIPVAQGGSNSIENAELTLMRINQMKMNRTPQQFLDDCKLVLEYHGFEIKKKQ